MDILEILSMTPYIHTSVRRVVAATFGRHVLSYAYFRPIINQKFGSC